MVDVDQQRLGEMHNLEVLTLGDLPLTELPGQILRPLRGETILIARLRDRGIDSAGSARVTSR